MQLVINLTKMLFFLAPFILCFIAPSNSQSYPVFGTKRYQRASNNAQMPVPASLVPNPSFYNAPPKYYYEERPVYAIPTYHESYPDDNPYYYYPRQEYYGMPIYHGEYKPTPYYYAHPPNFSYYDDREVGTNPMDDLHEEILQEDERERQRELFPVGQEGGWYDGSAGQQDELTNNFLKNLIAYNRQINAQEKQQEEEQMELEQNEARQRANYQNDRPSPMYDDEYGDYASSEYEYVPEQAETFSTKKLNMMEQPPKYEKYPDAEDENERQLKYLAHHQKPQQAQNKQYNQQPSHWNQPPPAINSRHHTDNKASYAEQETVPEYDEDTWINWDRKRSPNNEMKVFPQQNDESIKAFSDRKPTVFMAKIQSTMKPQIRKESLKSASKVQPSASPSSSSSTTSVPLQRATTVTTKPPKRSNDIFSGQKEVVLPRPAGSFPRSMFAKPLQDIAQATVNSVQETTGRTTQDEKSSVYDTIKQLIALQQKYQQNPSKLQKRFVSNEETLVRQLDSLKRRSV